MNETHLDDKDNLRHSDRVSMRIACQLSIGHSGPSDVVRRPMGGSGCYIVNLGDDGMQISTNILIKQEIKLTAHLNFEKEKKSLDFRFIVKWLRKNSYKVYGSYSYGLKFIDISQEDHTFLSEIYRREKEHLENKDVMED